MKKVVIFLGAIVCIGLLSSMGVNSKQWQHEYKDSKLDSFKNVAEDVKININHIHGDIKIVTGSGNSVKVNTNITLNAKSSKDLDILIKSVQPSVKMNNGEINIKTVIKKNNLKQSGMDIDYYIVVPMKYRLDINSIFGDVDIEDINNSGKIVLEHGDLEIKRSNSKTLDLNVEFGDIDLLEMPNTDAKIVIKHGDTTIESIHNLDIQSQFGDIEIASVNSVISQKIEHGDTDITLVKERFIAENVTFGDVEITCAPTIKEVTIKNQHSDIDVNLLKTFNFMLTATGSHSTFKPHNIDMTVKKFDDSGLSFNYQLAIGKNIEDSSKLPKIDLHTSFGDITINGIGSYHIDPL